MKTLLITIMLAMTACTTGIVDPMGFDAGPMPMDSSFAMDSSMDAGSNDPDAATESDAGPTRFDTGVTDARDIETPTCVDALQSPAYAVQMCLNFYRALNRVPDCEDRNIGTNYDDIGYIEEQEIPCPYIDFLDCDECDGRGASQCLQWVGAVVSRATCDEVIAHFDTPECGYPLCGFYR